VHGIQVQFLTYGDKSDREFEKILGDIELFPIYERMPKHKRKMLRILQSLFIPWIFRNELKETDVLKTNQMWGGWVAVIAKFLFSKPLIVRCGNEFYDFTMRHGSSKIFLMFAYLVSRLTYSQASRINVATEYDKSFVQRVFKIKSKCIDVRPNWIDQSLFLPLNKKRNNKVLFVGRMTDQKNLVLLINALKGTNIGLDVVGEGELHDVLKIQAEKNQININFLGVVSNEKMPLLYNKYPVYILCSRYEGNPKTLLEAMSCSCAVVGTDVAGINNIIQHGENGLLIPDNNPKELYKAIQDLLSSPELCTKLGKNACRYIKDNNSLDSAIIEEFNEYKALSTEK
jgi:glycosyltransferase involved in cell wall biosynthesis